MNSLVTVKKAKDQIKQLEHYVHLVESYETDSIEKLIIKSYAITNSMEEVVKLLKKDGYKNIDAKYVSSIISGKPMDELHKIIKSGYLKKTKGQRLRSKH